MQKLHIASGFTLIELLVTISIITILTGVSIPSFRNYQYKTGLDYTSKLIKNEIQFARSYSLSPPITYAGSDRDMFGIKIEPSNRKIIKVIKNSSTGIEETIESPIILADNYSITQFPSAPIYFKVGSNGDLYQPSTGSAITLKDIRTGNIKTITVDNLGLITIN